MLHTVLAVQHLVDLDLVADPLLDTLGQLLDGKDLACEETFRRVRRGVDNNPAFLSFGPLHKVTGLLGYDNSSKLVHRHDLIVVDDVITHFAYLGLMLSDGGGAGFSPHRSK